MPSGLLGGRFRSLRFRLTFWNTGAILLLVLATLVGLREGLRYTLRRELDALLAEDLLEVELAVDRYHPDWARIKEDLDRKAVSHKARSWFVRVRDAEGKLVLATAGAPGPPVATLGEGGSRPFNADSYRLVQRRLSGRGRPELIVRVGCSQGFVEDDVLNLSKMLVVVAVAFLVLAPLSGYWLAGRATRPLATILETTARLRPGRLDERVPLRGSGDELDRLAATINGLLDRLAAHQEKQREFVANAAHELRSPLAALRASAEVALTHDLSPEERRELLADMIEACEGLGGLVNQLLLLAEGEAGLPRAGGAVRLDLLAARSVEMFLGMAEERGLELRAAGLAAAPVRGDDTHLRQVVNNLIDNAIKFTPPGGRVTVEVRPASGAGSGPGEVLLRVSDSGVGIPAQDLPHVFERFYRADKSRRRAPARGGNGLGLSICQAIVGAHGGHISVFSEVGRGTTVLVWLPAA
jgi:signal transduction histidine kinase